MSDPAKRSLLPRRLLAAAGALLLAAGAGVGWMAWRLPPSVPEGSAAPPVVLRAADGTPLDLASFRGRPVLLDFFTST